jgi:hypothetical protein
MVVAARDPTVRRRRALTAAILILFMACITAVETLTERGGAWRFIDYARLFAILVLALLISVRATTNFTLTRRVPECDDELTRANRASAATWGYWGFFVALLAALGASFVLPVRLQELAPAVLVCGVAFAGLRFVLLERRGE